MRPLEKDDIEEIIFGIICKNKSRMRVKTRTSGLTLVGRGDETYAAVGRWRKIKGVAQPQPRRLNKKQNLDEIPLNRPT